MAKTLLLGLGGMGGRIVNNVMTELREDNIEINESEFCCAVFDTNTEDMDLLDATKNGIHIIPTSKDKTINSYIKLYEKNNINDWMPTSTLLRHEEMRWGTSQIRAMSRLAFYDVIQNRDILELEREIEKLLGGHDENCINVTIVSSLAGGTGSGMLIQTALWLRNLLEDRNCTVTIRGILVLPEALIKCVRQVGNDERMREKIRANAYATIRELNAITKIRTGVYKPQKRVWLDGFADSERKYECEDASVFDYAFFVDCDMDENNRDSIEDYEKSVARLTYMHMLAPASDGAYTKEDSAYRQHQLSKEPLYGLCDTAKAIYPTESILEYCTLRAIKDSLADSWRLLDQNMRDVQTYTGDIKALSDKHREYISQFNELSQKPEHRLLQRIRADIMNSQIELGKEVLTSKVDDFLTSVCVKMWSAIEECNIGELNRIKISEEKQDWVENKDVLKSREKAKSFVCEKREQVAYFEKTVRTKSEYIVKALIEDVCPIDMGKVDISDGASVMGLFTKRDNEGQLYFIHPIAMRYLIYKLLKELDAKMKQFTQLEEIKDRLVGIEYEGEVLKKEASRYLDKKPFLMSELTFIKKFKDLYYDFNLEQYKLCRQYVETIIICELSRELTHRLEVLAKVVESFFNNLDRVYNKIEDGLSINIDKTENCSRNTIYICGSRKEKEDLYKSLRLNVSKGNREINKAIADALYGQFCTLKNPNEENNAPYMNRSAIDIYYKETLNVYRNIIREDYSEEIDLDIYSAVCKSVDLDRENKLETNLDDLSDYENASVKHRYHLDAMKDLVKRLKTIGIPIITKDNEKTNNTGYGVTFWGFSPKLVEMCDKLGEILGINVLSQQNNAYSKNELNCYCSVYGFTAGEVDKLNELRENEADNYYACYKKIMDRINNELDYGNKDALVQTPHLDKTWHKILPYISLKKKD
ncbi:MAG: hypothetical protein IJ039_01170 [Clostridia bacterium]|nr:hypothetical protein [Clostridia bacterium]